MMLTCSDDECRYRIEVPDGYSVLLDYEGCDFLVVPDPDQPETPYWLSGFILVEAARAGEFGLRLVAEEPV